MLAEQGVAQSGWTLVAAVAERELGQVQGQVERAPQRGGLNHEMSEALCFETGDACEEVEDDSRGRCDARYEEANGEGLGAGNIYFEADGFSRCSDWLLRSRGPKKPLEPPPSTFCTY